MAQCRHYLHLSMIRPGAAKVQGLQVREHLIEARTGEREIRLGGDDRLGLERDPEPRRGEHVQVVGDRKSTRLNSSHVAISYAVFCLKKKKRSPLMQIACLR